MLIVTQNREKIVNFNNVDNIDIVASLDGTGDIPYIIYYETSTRREELGIYETKERAKEVLQEIINNYREYRIAVSSGFMDILDKTSIYEMPEE